MYVWEIQSVLLKWITYVGVGIRQHAGGGNHSDPEHKRQYRKGLASRHHVSLAHAFVAEYALLQYDHLDHSCHNQHELEIEVQVRQRLCGISNQQQRSGYDLDPESDPHRGIQPFEWSDR